jgi:ribosomal protein S27E
MDSQDRPPDRTTDIECAACGRTVAWEAVRVLAERDDLAFVEVPCAGCGSRSLAMLVAAAFEGDEDRDRHDDLNVLGRSEPSPVDHEDVAAVRTFLAGYHGDLRGLVGPGRSDGRESAGPA